MPEWFIITLFGIPKIGTKKKKEKQTKFPPLLILLNNLLLLYTRKEQSLLFLSCSHKFCDAVLHKMPIIFKVESCIPDSKIFFIRSCKFGLGSLLHITRARCSGSPRGAPFWTGKTPAVLLAGLKRGSDRRHAVWNSMALGKKHGFWGWGAMVSTLKEEGEVKILKFWEYEARF